MELELEKQVSKR